MPVDQLAIMLTGVISAWMLNDLRGHIRKWGCVIGLLGQPFWAWSTFNHSQWGMLAVTVGYTVAFMRGIWVMWICPHFKKENLPPPQLGLVWDEAVEKATENALFVFKDGCNHTLQSIDYMRALMHYTYKPDTPETDCAHTS